MTLGLPETSPFETASVGSFLMFEVGKEVLGFSYSSLGSFTLTKAQDSHEEFEKLVFVFSNHEIQVTGNHLRRLLLLIHKQELFLLRVGASQDPKFPKIIKIESIILERDDL
jgi:hypothetical protein